MVRLQELEELKTFTIKDIDKHHDQFEEFYADTISMFYEWKVWRSKDVLPRYMNTYKIPNVHMELEFAMVFCIDRLVNDFDKLILFRGEMNEKMKKFDNETKNEKSMKNTEVIETLMGMEQNKGVRKTKKIMKGKKEIAAEKAKNDGIKCHKCGKYIKYDPCEKHDARNCHKFATEGMTSNV
uniref:Uncharacterized protein n=1 Tax=Lactuca sativa TaxID=4236 RepID=A0A9R1UI23_LACSA|nr:hypothetical protein LSAT_V11C900498220 [Lactuca sativa]